MRNQMCRFSFFVMLTVLFGLLCNPVIPSASAKEKRTPEEAVIWELSLLKRFIPNFKKTLDLNEKTRSKKVDSDDPEAKEQYEAERSGIRKATEGHKNLSRDTLADARKALKGIPDSNPKKAEYQKQIDQYQAQYNQQYSRLQRLIKRIDSAAPEKETAEIKPVDEVKPAEDVKPASCQLDTIKLTRGPWNPCRKGKCYAEFSTAKSQLYFEAKDAKGTRVYVKCGSTQWKGVSQMGKNCQVVGMPSDPASHSYGSCAFLPKTSKNLNRLRKIDYQRFWKPRFKKAMAAKTPPLPDADGSLVGGAAEVIEECIPTASSSVLDLVGTRKEPENWTVPEDGKNHRTEARYYESSAHLVYGLSLGAVSAQCKNSEGLNPSQKVCVIPATCTRPVSKDKYSTVIVCGSNVEGGCPAFDDCKLDTEKFDMLSSVAAAAEAAPADPVPDAAAPAEATDSGTTETPIRLRDR